MQITLRYHTWIKIETILTGPLKFSILQKQSIDHHEKLQDSILHRDFSFEFDAHGCKDLWNLLLRSSNLLKSRIQRWCSWSCYREVVLQWSGKQSFKRLFERSEKECTHKIPSGYDLWREIGVVIPRLQKIFKESSVFDHDFYRNGHEKNCELIIKIFLRLYFSDKAYEILYYL